MYVYCWRSVSLFELMRCHFISLVHLEIDLQDHYQSFLKVILDTSCDNADQVIFLCLCVGDQFCSSFIPLTKNVKRNYLILVFLIMQILMAKLRPGTSHSISKYCHCLQIQRTALLLSSPIVQTATHQLFIKTSFCLPNLAFWFNQWLEDAI